MKRRDRIDIRHNRLKIWIQDLPPPRKDIQTALDVIGHRELEHIRYEELKGYKLDLRATNLRRADLYRARLDGALLTGARLEGANLSAAQLRGADISDAHLELVELTGATLTDAKLNHARLEYACLKSAKMKRTQRKNARLDGAFLSEAMMPEAVLDQASMQEAYLDKTDLRSTNLISLIGLSGIAHSADLRGAKVTQEQLDNIFGDQHTLLPDKSYVPESYYVWSCWDDIYAAPSTSVGEGPGLTVNFRCGLNNPRHKTGTPLALNGPYPDGHPLASRK